MHPARLSGSPLPALPLLSPSRRMFEFGFCDPAGREGPPRSRRLIAPVSALSPAGRPPRRAASPPTRLPLGSTLAGWSLRTLRGQSWGGGVPQSREEACLKSLGPGEGVGERRVETPRRPLEGPGRPSPPPWQLMWEERTNLEPGGPLWEIALSPFYRRHTWGPEKDLTGQSPLPQPPIKIAPSWV